VLVHCRRPRLIWTTGWKCCKPRVLTFDEFLTIPPCTTGKHSTVDDTPAEPEKPKVSDSLAAVIQSIDAAAAAPQRLPQAIAPQARSTPPPPPEDDSDDLSTPIPDGQECRRRGCTVKFKTGASRDGEECTHHPGQPVFHEGSKGWTCCKRRVLEFDEFMKIEGCKTRDRHMFVGKKKDGEEVLQTVRHDYYQTPSSVIASLFLKKIDKETSTVKFTSDSVVDLDLHTSDKKHYKTSLELYGKINAEKSNFKILGTKLELTLAKADGASWPVLKADDPHTGSILQVGRAGVA